MGGGSINSVILVELEKSKIVLKINDSLRFPGMFENEKKGLLKLNKSGIEQLSCCGEKL